MTPDQLQDDSFHLQEVQDPEGYRKVVVSSAEGEEELRLSTEKLLEIAAEARGRGVSILQLGAHELVVRPQEDAQTLAVVKFGVESRLPCRVPEKGKKDQWLRVTQDGIYLQEDAHVEERLYPRPDHTVALNKKAS